jgi:hypothetical protein
MRGVDFVTEENQWDSDADPLEDMRRAIAKMKEPTPESYYRNMGEMERDLQTAIDLLDKDGKTPQEIIELLIKHGIWGSF